jgi:hypothetical protein
MSQTQRKHQGFQRGMAALRGNTGPQRPMDGPGGIQWQCSDPDSAPEVISVNTTCDQTSAFQKSALMATSILTAIFGATTIILILALVMKAQKQAK